MARPPVLGTAFTAIAPFVLVVVFGAASLGCLRPAISGPIATPGSTVAVTVPPPQPTQTESHPTTTHEPTPPATKSPRAGATSSPIRAGVVAEFQNPDGPDPADYPPDGYPFFETAHALPTFTRLWIDDNQRDVHMALTGDIDGAIEAIGDDVPRGITVYFHVAAYSQAELCSLRDAMFDDREELMDRGIVLTSGGCGNADNRVNVGISPLTSEAVAYMRARYAGPVHYEDGGASALRPYEPPELEAVELVADRDGQDTGLLTCGRRPFPAAAMDSLPVNLDSAGHEYGALRDALKIYVHLYGDLTRLEWLLVERDDYGATFIADRADTWLEASVFAGIEGWVPGTVDYCSPRPLSASDGGIATVYLDPAFPKPKAAATKLHVLVTEDECASGRSPAGRLLPPTVRYDDASVTITVRIRSNGGPAACPSNPLLPVTIQLPEPIGDRPLRGIAGLPQH